MTKASSERVLVAAELRDLAGPAPAWPRGRKTEYWESGTRTPSGRDVVALVPLVSHTVGEAEISALPDLLIVANYGVGYDNIDLDAARRRRVVVTNTPDVLTDATADLTLALLLATARRLREGLDLARSGNWKGWHPTQLLGTGLQGKRLGVLGAGRIGSAVATRAAAFGMEIVYWDRNPVASLEERTSARRASSLEEVLEEADFVTIHLTLSAETRGLIGATELALMKPGAVLLNTGRGPIVTEPALVDALRSGHLAAAGLDVFEHEPAISASLRELSNAFLLPHLGSATREARQAMWDLAAANVRAVLAGKPPLTAVA